MLLTSLGTRPRSTNFGVPSCSCPTARLPDASGVHAELLKVLVQTTDPAGDAVVAEFHDLVQRLWRGEDLDLTTWHSSLLFSIWKGRGLVTDLDGHRGIVLLDVLHKVVCKLLASRLSELAEKHCAESETGLSKRQRLHRLALPDGDDFFRSGAALVPLMPMGATLCTSCSLTSLVPLMLSLGISCGLCCNASWGSLRTLLIC